MPPSTPDPTLWLTDLMAKQQELLKSLAPPGTPAAADPANPLAPWMQAANAFTQWQQQALQQMTMMRTAAVPAGAATPAVDRRFAADPWCQDPRFDGIARAYLSQSELLRQTLDTAPLDERSKAQWGFVLRQVVDALSPANCLATNPEALQAALDSGGASLVEGTRLFMEDFAKGRVSMTDETAFEVGRNVATTPGRCGVRERADPAHPVHAADGAGPRAAVAGRAAVHQQVLHPRPAARELVRRAMRWRRATRCSWCRGATPGAEQGESRLGRLHRAGRDAGDRRGARDQRRRPGQHAGLLRRRHAARQRARGAGGARRRQGREPDAADDHARFLGHRRDRAASSTNSRPQRAKRRSDRAGCSRAASWHRCSPRCAPTT